VKHLKEAFADIARGWSSRGVGFVAINANDFEKYPDDAPAKMREDAEAFAYPFPYLVDEDQSVARAYDAACTPDFFVFGADGKLAYRGQFDGSRPGNDEPVTGADLKSALEAITAGAVAPEPQLPSMGCGIKWKA
jgi:hypothetical protein